MGGQHLLLHVVGAYAPIRQQVVNAGQGQVGLAQQCRAVRGQGASWVSVFKVCSPGWQKRWDHHKAEESAGGGRFFRFEVEIRRKGIKKALLAIKKRKGADWRQGSVIGGGF